VARSGQPGLRASQQKSLCTHARPKRDGGTDGCKLEKWDRSADLAKITVPTLVIGARHGSHLALYDDQQTWFTELIKFLKDVDAVK